MLAVCWQGCDLEGDTQDAHLGTTCRNPPHRSWWAAFIVTILGGPKWLAYVWSILVPMVLVDKPLMWLGMIPSEAWKVQRQILLPGQLLYYLALVHTIRAIRLRTKTRYTA